MPLVRFSDGRIYDRVVYDAEDYFNELKCSQMGEGKIFIVKAMVG